MGSTSPLMDRPSVLLAYAFVKFMLYLVMRALGEMIFINPTFGSFADCWRQLHSPLAGCSNKVRTSSNISWLVLVSHCR